MLVPEFRKEKCKKGQKKHLLRWDEMKPNIFTELFSPVNIHDRPLPSTQNPRFSKHFFKKSHPCSRIIWSVTLDISEDALRDDSNYYYIGEYLVRHRWKNQWLNKINIILSFWWSNYSGPPTKRSAMGLEKIFRQGIRYIGVKSHGHTFSISHRLCNKWACDQAIPRAKFFSTRTENHSHTNER